MLEGMKTTEDEIRKLKLEILKQAEAAMEKAVTTRDSEMVTAIAELVKAF